MNILNLVLSPFKAMKERKEDAKRLAELHIKRMNVFNEKTFDNLNHPNDHIALGFQIGYNQALDHYYSTGIKPQLLIDDVNLEHWTKYRKKGIIMGNNRALDHIEEYEDSLLKNS